MKQGRRSESTGRISIERYINPKEVGSVGLVEGVREDGSSWIVFLDADGSPECFWGLRDECGGVIGDPILLQ